MRKLRPFFVYWGDDNSVMFQFYGSGVEVGVVEGQPDKQVRGLQPAQYAQCRLLVVGQLLLLFRGVRGLNYHNGH